MIPCLTLISIRSGWNISEVRLRKNVCLLLQLSVEAIAKGDFESPSAMVSQQQVLYMYIYIEREVKIVCYIKKIK